MAERVCALVPDKKKDRVTGRMVDSNLFADIRMELPHKLSWIVYKEVTSPEFTNEYPAIKLDTLGEPLWGYVKEIPKIKLYLDENGFDRNQTIKLLNARYGIKDTTDFNKVALSIGALGRSEAYKDKYMAIPVKSGYENKQEHFTVSIVERTPENEAELARFLENRGYVLKLLAIAAQSGIAVESVHTLCDDVSGVYDSQKPRRLFHNLFALILLNQDKLLKLDREKRTEEEAKTIAEELGHAIVEMYRNNPEYKETFDKYIELILNLSRGLLTSNEKEVQKVRKVLIEEFSLAKIDLAELARFDKVEDVSNELAGKIIGSILYNNQGKKLSKGTPLSRGTFRVFRKLGRGFNSLKTSLWNVIKGSINTISDNSIMSETLLSDGAAYYELSVANDVKDYANSIINTFLEGSLDVKDALKSQTLLKRESSETRNFARDIKQTFDNLIVTLNNSNMLTGKEYKELKSSGETAYNTFKMLQEKKLISEKANTALYLNEMLKSFKKVASDTYDDMSKLTDDFKKMCDEALASGKTKDYSFDVIYAAGHIATLPLQMRVLNEMNIVLRYIQSLNDTIGEVSEQLSVYNLTQRNLMSNMLTLLMDYAGTMKKMYDRLAKGSLVAECALFNNGKLYIERGSRMMETAKTMEELDSKTGKPTGKKVKFHKKLTAYEGRRIAIAELIDELSTADGYFDMTLYGLYLLSAGNSVDPITLLFDLNNKQRAFYSNIQNLRWQRIMLEFRQKVYKLTGSYNVDWMFETIKDESGNIVKTGNIRQRFKWGLWERDYAKALKEFKEDVIKNHKDLFEGKDAATQAALFWSYKQQFYKDWHGKYSKTINNKNHFYQLTKDGRVKAFNFSNMQQKIEVNDTEKALDDLLNLSKTDFVPNANLYTDTSFDTDLTQELQLLIDEYLMLKAQLDSLLNDYREDCTRLYRLPLFRGNTINRMNTQGVGKMIGDSISEVIFEDAQDTDFGDLTTYNDEDDLFDTGASRSVREIKQRIPMVGINKLNNMDALSTDIFRSTLAYAVMVNNINAKKDLADTASIALDVLGKRKIEGERESDRVRRGVNRSRIYQRFEKFVEMQIFGKYSTVESIQFTKKKKLVAQKIVRKLNAITSWMLLAGKFTGGNVNTGTGIWQLLKECAVDEHFGYGLFLKACGLYTYYGIGSNFGAGDTKGFAANMRDNAMYRYLAYFDSLDKNAQKLKDMDTKLPLILKMNWAMCFYENGDHFIHAVPYMAKGMNTKLYKRENVLDEKTNTMRVEYKEVGSVWDVFKNHFEKHKNDDTNAYTKDGRKADWGDPYSYYEDEFVNGKLTKVRKLYYVKSNTAEELDFKVVRGINMTDTLNKKIELLENDLDNLKERRLLMETSGVSKDVLDRDALYIRINELINKLLLLIDKYDKIKEKQDYSEIDDDFEYFNPALFQDSCRLLCNNLNGIYNSLDGVAAQQSIFGAMMLTMKKYYLGYANQVWMTSRDNVASGKDIEGFGITALKALRRYVFDTDHFSKTAALGFGSLGLASTVAGLSLILGHSLILPNFINLACVGMMKLTMDNQNFRDRMLRDKWSLSLALNFKRFFRNLYTNMIFFLLRSLIDIVNFRFKEDEDDDDKENPEDWVDDYEIIETEEGTFSLKRKKSKKTKGLFNLDFKLNLNPFGKKKEKKEEKHFSSYGIDEAILKWFGVEDYSDRASLLSGNTGHEKTPGILATLLLTTKAEDGTWVVNKPNEESINKGMDYRDDLLGAYRKLGIASYFIHRLATEQAVFNPTYGLANAANAIKEGELQWKELTNAIAPVAASYTLETLFKLIGTRDYSNRYLYDKNTSFWDWKSYDYLKENPDKTNFYSTKFDREFYQAGNFRHTMLGDYGIFNTFLEAIPLVTSLPTFMWEPYKGETAYDFMRSSR